MGRDDALAAIETALRRYKGRAAITALHGLRGVGKSTLAAAFAERHRADYRATWWIRAQTEPTARPRQIDLFAEDTGKTAPTWRELPEEARVRLTDLMARLILDHARLDGAIPSKEVGDDL